MTQRVYYVLVDMDDLKIVDDICETYSEAQEMKAIWKEDFDLSTFKICKITLKAEGVTTIIKR